MALVETLSKETVYATKGNIAYPVVGASASAIATLAQNRMQDALPGVTVTVAAGNISVVKQ